MRDKGLVAALLACACAHAPSPSAPRAGRPMQLEGLLITPTEVVDAPTLFEHAGRDLAAKRFRQAAAGYDTLVVSFPDSGYVLPALYNAGLAYEGLGDYARAAERDRELMRRFPDTGDAMDAAYKLGACYAELGNWPASAEIYARLLERKDLSLPDRIQAMARRGYAQYHLHDLDTAERTFRATLDYYQKHEEEERLDDEFFLALAQYHLGVVAKERYEAIAIRLPERQMNQDIEAKAHLLLDAQAKFIKTLRLRNPHWAAAAGYQIGVLYRSFYDALVGAPVPDEVAGTEELKSVYFDELKKRIRPLLEKAVHTHEQTLLMAERTGIDNDFVKRSSQELEMLRKFLLEQGAPAEPAPRPSPVAPPPEPKAPPRPPGRPGDGLGPRG